MHSIGEGYERAKDYLNAKRSYERAWQEEGNVASAMRLGILHLSGKIPEGSKAEAYQYFKIAAKAAEPNIDAMLNLGEMLCYGDGVARDLNTALHWYRQVLASDETGKAGRRAKVQIEKHASAVAKPKLTPIALYRTTVGSVWSGKYPLQAGETQPKYVVFKEKPGGCAAGALYRKIPTHPSAAVSSAGSGKIWLGKMGESLGGDERRSLAPRSILRLEGSWGAVKEIIAAAVYKIASACNTGASDSDYNYHVPKHRLARLPMFNAYTKDNLLVQAVYDAMNQGRAEPITETTYLMSKWIDGYQDLSALSVQISRTDEIMPLMCYIEKYHRFPEKVFLEGCVLPIYGIMEILAVSRLLGDTDVLGGGGKNAGFIVERTVDGEPIAVRAIKIDAGNAFNFTAENNQLANYFSGRSVRLEDSKDLQFGNAQPVSICWGLLSDGQRKAFMCTLTEMIALLNTSGVMRNLIYRDGLFNCAEAGLMTEARIERFTADWKRYIALQQDVRVYGPEISREGARLVRGPSPTTGLFIPGRLGAAPLEGGAGFSAK